MGKMPAVAQTVAGLELSITLHQEACPMSIDCPILCWLLSPGRQAWLHLHFTEGPRPVWSPCGLPEVRWQEEEEEEEAWGRVHQWPELTLSHSTPHQPSSEMAGRVGSAVTWHERTPPLSGSLLLPSLPQQQCWALGTQAPRRHEPALGAHSRSFIYSAMSV